MALSSFMVKKIEKKKKQLEEWRIKHDATVPFPDNVKVDKNIPYMDDGQTCHLMDVYYPDDLKGPFPVVVHVHGGGYLLGHKEVNRHFCGVIAELGYVVFSVEYPFVEDVLLYQIFEDVSRAFDKIDSFMENYKGDREHVFWTGDGSGAHLITYLAAMQRCQAIADAANVTPAKLPVKALGLVSGMFYTDKYNLGGRRFKKALYGTDWKNHPFRKYINPEHMDILGNLPPCYFVTSFERTEKDHCVAYAGALKKHGFEYRLAVAMEKKADVHAYSVFFPERGISVETNDAMFNYMMRF